MLRTPILIVDDEPSIREGLQEFLDDEGYDVHVSPDGRNALDVYRRVHPDLVVMDLRMPGLPGIEVIRRIKNLDPHAVIIVVTGYGSLDTAVDAIRLNVFDFISKPIDLEQLKATLDRAKETVQMGQKTREEIESIREQLIQARDHLEKCRQGREEIESFAVAGRLLTGILHNLNNPLNYIMGEIQILQMIYPERKVFERIDKQACRIAQIIRSVLGKVKQSSVRQEEMLDLNKILEEEVIFLESHPYFQGDIQKEWLLAKDLPPFKGVAADFGQIIGNLLSNAAEAMKDQVTKKLILCTSHTSFEITLAIGDTGPGIPADQQEKIFEPFFSTKVEKVGLTGSLGMGLGLYSCRQIAQQYGGDIEVISHPGEGAMFVIRIPLKSDY